jgi:DNA-directed RNA polymerase beta subunit
MAIATTTRHDFGVKQHAFPVPNLNSMQTISYQKFWEEEASKILQEFSPIEDPAGNRWRVVSRS